MRNPIVYIRQNLSVKLSLTIFLFVVVVFITSVGFLFYRSRQMVRQEAMDRADRLLDLITMRVSGYLVTVETATQNMEWEVLDHLEPDSLLAYSRRVVQLNPFVNSCSITTEPYFFQQYGRYFSAYSVRMGEGDSIETVREGEYEYFEKVWYKTPRSRGEACWVDPFDDYNEGTLSSSEVIASYCVPLYNDKCHFIGVLSTDLSLRLLSQAISKDKPYPHSYCVMLGGDGHYYVHPDTTKLFHKTIFDEVDTRYQADGISLGHEMLQGHQGVLQVNIGGKDSWVFYQPVPQTQWSIALVCSDNDIFGSYNRLMYFLAPLLIFGLLVLLWMCRRMVNHFMNPLSSLVAQTRLVSQGQFGTPMPRSKRQDIVGRLQNNFADMQQSLKDYVSQVNKTNEEAASRNRQLQEAISLVQESDCRKTDSLQDMSRQIRISLNNLTDSFRQLSDDCQQMSAEDMRHVTDSMQENAASLDRSVHMLYEAWWQERHEDLETNGEVANE
jgi:HAMP domain-containing protein